MNYKHINIGFCIYNFLLATTLASILPLISMTNKLPYRKYTTFTSAQAHHAHRMTACLRQFGEELHTNN